ncbi:Alpha/Beta hydrolase protein [Thelonectria olida]|uniref:Alpha/Beta hydrolase protein n=1 Tax=Thelonectria olida TaxID=1576542 RepID=A0A9P9AQE0_9HYPO|nr:Alpha/Beta hydrolase protein [Thelonectria olida]
MAQQTDKTASGQELFFESHNPSASTTIVLLHGLFSCHLEWEHVVPYLADYHLIIPDHPHHSRSKLIRPFSLPLAADKVAALIEQHANGGKAYVVGLSLGGFVTMELIRRHPQLVEAAFVTGSAPFSDWQVWASQRPSMLHWGLWFVMSSGLYRAAEWHTALKPHNQLKSEMAANNQWDLVHDAYGELSRWQEEAVKDLGAKDKRILVVAGGHGDNLGCTKKLAEGLRQEGGKDGKETRGVFVNDAIHGWNLQFPELFADGIKAWIKREPLPERFEALP